MTSLGKRALEVVTSLPELNFMVLLRLISIEIEAVSFSGELEVSTFLVELEVAVFFTKLESVVFWELENSKLWLRETLMLWPPWVNSKLGSFPETLTLKLWSPSKKTAVVMI